MTLALLVVAIALGLLALVAWGSAWQTLHWLGDAEDLLELIRDDPHQADVSGPLRLELEGWRRRTPRRTMGGAAAARKPPWT